MSDDQEGSGSRHGSPQNGKYHGEVSPAGRDFEKSNNHKAKRSRSRSPRKMSRGSKYRSRSRSPRRRSRKSRSRSYSPRRHRSQSHSPMSHRRRHTGCRDNPQANRCVGIFGLSVHTTEEELRHILTKYGPVERIQTVIDAKTGRSRGFAFAYFESVEDAKIAKEQCNDMEFDGRRIRVDFSITQRAHTPTPGIYMGKPTYERDGYGRDRGDRGERSGGGGRGYRDHDRDDYYGGGGGGGYRGGGGGGYRGSSPHYRPRRRYDRSRSRSYSPRRY